MASREGLRLGLWVELPAPVLDSRVSLRSLLLQISLQPHEHGSWSHWSSWGSPVPQGLGAAPVWGLVSTVSESLEAGKPAGGDPGPSLGK